MDNKLTKTRLSNFLSYEWLIIIIVSLASLLIWELIYTVSAVRLTAGQQFKYYYDQGVSSIADTSFYNLFGYGEKNGTFSYDVLEFTNETLTGDFNVLSIRLSVQEGDAIISDTFKEEPEIEGGYGKSRANTLIDELENVPIYSMEDLLESAKKYLAGFLRDGVTGEDAELEFFNLDENKIAANFLERMAKDNRFRKDGEKAEGIKLEEERIKKLCGEVDFLKKVMEYDLEISEDNPENSLFYRYTRYEQAINVNTNPNSADAYKKLYDEQVKKAKDYGYEDGTLRYGLNVSALKGGKHDTAEFFKRNNSTNSENVVVLIFNLETYQPDLQYETISFLNTIIRSCSDLGTILNV